MSSANTWYQGTSIDMSGATGYLYSYYKAAMYFSVLEDGNSTYKIRLYGSVYFNEWTGWSGSSLTLDGTSKVSGSNIYSSSGTGYATNGPWTKDISITKTSSSQSKAYSCSAFCGGSAWSSVSITVSVPALASYTISYNLNGGTSAAIPNTTKYYDVNVNLSSTVPTRPGYAFLGWSESSSAVTASYQAGGSFSTNANTTLYAVWDPQASAIDQVSNVTIPVSGSGSVSVKWTPLLSSFKYKIRFDVAGQQWDSAIITPNSTDQRTYTDSTNFVASLANRFTNSTSVTGTCYLFTYDRNNNQLGDATYKNFTVTLHSGFVPTISNITVENVEDAPKFNVYTKDISKVKIKVTASGIQGSTISKVYVDFLGTTYEASPITEGGVVKHVVTTNTVTSYGSGKVIKVTAVDSRTRQTVNSSNSITIYNYFVPVGSFKLSVSGTTITCTVTGEVASVNNTNTFTLTIKRTKVDDPSDTETRTFQGGASVSGGLSYSFTKVDNQTVSDAQTATYIYEVSIKDKKNKTYSESQKTAVIVISRLRGGNGVTFFAEAEDTGFWVLDRTSKDYLQHDISSSAYISIATMLATNYSTTKTWFAGEFMKKDSHIYEAKVEIPLNESWTASHWQLLS